jgi:hypothetical protein
MEAGIEQLIVSIVSLLIGISASLIAAVYLRSRRPLKVVLIIALLLFIVGTLIPYISISSKIADVPYLKELSVADATSRLAERELKADFSEQYNGAVEKGRVINQDTSPGLSVWKGTVVHFIVSKGPPIGVIVVESIPSGADVYLDETSQGITPINVSSLSGKHTVKIQKSDCIDWSQSLTVIGDSTSSVYAQLNCPPSNNKTENTSGDVYLASVRKLSSGYDIGVDDSQHIRNWLTDMGDYMRMTYPNGLEWGAVFITVGKPRDPPRPFKDFSTFSTLSMDLRGEKGGESIEIGIKDNTDPDDGSETKSPVYLTTEWKTYTFPISKFYTAEPTRLYVVAEFVFSGSNAKTIYFRNIKYLP